VFHRSSFSTRSFSDRAWRFPETEAPPSGLPAASGGGGRAAGLEDEAERIRGTWDQIDALRAPLAADTAPPRADARRSEPSRAVEPAQAAQEAAVDIVLPSGKLVAFDPGTRALVVPSDGISDDDMEAALLAVCLLALDD
jgi:hypothetical protein